MQGSIMWACDLSRHMKVMGRFGPVSQLVGFGVGFSLACLFQAKALAHMAPREEGTMWGWPNIAS